MPIGAYIHINTWWVYWPAVVHSEPKDASREK